MISRAQTLSKYSAVRDEVLTSLLFTMLLSTANYGSMPHYPIKGLIRKTILTMTSMSHHGMKDLGEVEKQARVVANLPRYFSQDATI